MPVVLHQERLVAALVEMSLPARAVAAVPSLGVPLGQAAHEAAEIAVAMRPEDEVQWLGIERQASRRMPARVRSSVSRSVNWR